MSATRYAVDGGVATITLAQPETRNALSLELVTGLLGHLDVALLDRRVRSIVVTNEGTVFCAGADLSAISALAEGGIELADVFRRLLDSPKPTVGRIAGHCRGGGVGLAAALDISVAAGDATFAFSEARLGVAPAVISVVCLPKMRRADASELFLRAAPFSAADAVRVGLVNHSVPTADLDGTIAAITTDLAAGGPEALAMCKQLIARVADLDRAAGFALTNELSRQLFASDEGREGVAAFRERRPPRWLA